MSKGIKVNKDFEIEILKMEFQINFFNKPEFVNSNILIGYVNIYLNDFSNRYCLGVMSGIITGFALAGVISSTEYERLCSVLDSLKKLGY
ncbi:hypothetical protein [Sedimentibacter sp.]|uniref:hypothetical protein n=1 Tax=Sedimentibacter sp. TaxID=1960295 RepID=UPI0028AE3D15|nr:hypothetical protein [Sedimentibacter sp.]